MRNNHSKALLAALILILSPSLYAQSDYSLGWDINISVTGATYTRLQLDLDVGTNYFGIHGGASTSANFTTPVTGTCFFTASDGLYCNMQADQYSINFTINSDLSGFYEVKDADGFIVATSGATYNPNI